MIGLILLTLLNLLAMSLNVFVMHLYHKHDAQKDWIYFMSAGFVVMNGAFLVHDILRLIR